MTIEFRCPTCEKLLRTGDDKAGATAKCPQCGGLVTVPAASVAEVSPAQEFGHPPLRESSSYQDTTDFTQDIACPMCGAANNSTAQRCLACGEELWEAVDSQQRSPIGRSFSAIWRSAWESWTTNLGICVAAAAIGGGFFLAAYIIFIVMMIVLGAGIASVAGNQTAEVAAVIAMMGSGCLLMLLAYAYLLAGFSNLSLQIVRQRGAGIGALFPPVSQAVRAVVCTFLVMLGLCVTSLPGAVLYGFGIAIANHGNDIALLFMPLGYAVMLAGWSLGWTFFWPVHYLIANEPVSIVAAMSRGVRLAMTYPKLSFLMALAHTGLMLAGFLTCYLGFLFTAPLSFMLFAVAFNRCEKSARVA